MAGNIFSSTYRALPVCWETGTGRLSCRHAVFETIEERLSGSSPNIIGLGGRESRGEVRYGGVYAAVISIENGLELASRRISRVKQAVTEEES